MLAASAAGVCQACKDPRFKKKASPAVSAVAPRVSRLVPLSCPYSYVPPSWAQSRCCCLAAAPPLTHAWRYLDVVMSPANKTPAKHRHWYWRRRCQVNPLGPVQKALRPRHKRFRAWRTMRCCFTALRCQANTVTGTVAVRSLQRMRASSNTLPVIRHDWDYYSML